MKGGMRGTLFPEHSSSSESESEVDSDVESGPRRVRAPVPVDFRCAPKVDNEAHAKSSSIAELFVLDTDSTHVDKPTDGGDGGNTGKEDTTEVTVIPGAKAGKGTQKKSGKDAKNDQKMSGKKKISDERGKKRNETNDKKKGKTEKKTAKPGEATMSAVDDKVVKELLAKSVIKPGFEKIWGEGHKPVSKRALVRQRRVERERTKGAEWFDLPATEMTDERERDLQIVQMRDALDTKTHYKRNDRSVLPKYFQVGTVVENKADFYSSRVPKKQRKRTIVEELMADEEFQTRQKKKYDEIKAVDAVKRRGTFQHSTYRRRTRQKLKQS